jgi:UDP-2,3-diacylglucosamine pyrophosphatase LpxH
MVKEGVNFIGNYEHCISKYTKEKGCDGVICGHIHTPIIKEINNVLYCNTGDWVESCSAIVEHEDGTLELFIDQC